MTSFIHIVKIFPRLDGIAISDIIFLILFIANFTESLLASVLAE